MVVVGIGIVVYVSGVRMAVVVVFDEIAVVR